MKRTLSLTLILILLVTSSCGSGSAETEDPSAAPAETEAQTQPAETEVSYGYDKPAMDGYEFTILNCIDELWGGSNHVIDYNELIGEPVQDAIYTRARQVEEEMNLKLNVSKFGIFDLYGELSKEVLSGGGNYDAAYTPLSHSNTPLAGEYGYNLYDIDTLHLSENWWNQSFVDTATLFGDQLYASIDYINMMGYSYGNVMYFNKDMMIDHSLEIPYDTIREGKWTYDVMNQQMSAVVNLNGDATFAADNNGNCVWGYAVQHAEGTMSLLDGAGEFLVVLDDDNAPVLRSDNVRLLDAYDTLVNMLSADGYCVMKNTAEVQGQIFFSNNRALFYQSSLGLSAANFRELEFEYGVIPLPKFDESQSRYYTMVSEYTLTLSVPKSVQNVSDSGAVLDYLAFLGMKDVIPELQTTLCYKGTRDEDSIEMMELLLDTMTVDIGYVYGWTKSMMTDLCNKMITGNSTFASSLESKNDSIRKAIDKTMASMTAGN